METGILLKIEIWNYICSLIELRLFYFNRRITQVYFTIGVMIWIPVE